MSVLADSGDLQVVLINDDETPMEFVVEVLQQVFAMNREDAVETMLEVHRSGKAVCGLYARDDAEAVVKEVSERARRKGYPLICRTTPEK